MPLINHLEKLKKSPLLTIKEDYPKKILKNLLKKLNNSKLKMTSLEKKSMPKTDLKTIHTVSETLLKTKNLKINSKNLKKNLSKKKLMNVSNSLNLTLKPLLKNSKLNKKNSKIFSTQS
jgi:hypothetical protein